MNVIDFTKGIGYKVIRFPDGEVHLQLDEINRKEGVKVVMRIRNAEDLFLLMQLTDVLHRQEVVVDELHIPYLMSMRCDRVFSFDRPFSLKIVANIINSMDAKKVILNEPHSDKTSMIKNVEIFSTATEDLEYYERKGPMCFPDEGAMKRFEHYDDNYHEYPVIFCKKVRDVDTGKIVKIEIENGLDLNGNYDITVLDDLCDGGGTFVALAPKLRELHPRKLRLVVTHAVQKQGILNVASAYDEVVITNTYADWDTVDLPDNVKVVNVLP